MLTILSQKLNEIESEISELQGQKEQLRRLESKANQALMILSDLSESLDESSKYQLLKSIQDILGIVPIYAKRSKTAVDTRVMLSLKD